MSNASILINTGTGPVVHQATEAINTKAKAPLLAVLPMNAPARFVFAAAVANFLESIDNAAAAGSKDYDYDVCNAERKMRQATDDLIAARRVAVLDAPRAADAEAAENAAKQQKVADYIKTEQEAAQIRYLQKIADYCGIKLLELAKYGAKKVAAKCVLFDDTKTPPTVEHVEHLFATRPEFQTPTIDPADLATLQPIHTTFGPAGVPPTRTLLATGDSSDAGSSSSGGSNADSSFSSSSSSSSGGYFNTKPQA